MSPNKSRDLDSSVIETENSSQVIPLILLVARVFLAVSQHNRQHHDGSERVHKAVYAMASDTIVVEAQTLPAKTINQQAELIALTMPIN